MLALLCLTHLTLTLDPKTWREIAAASPREKGSNDLTKRSPLGYYGAFLGVNSD